MFNFPGWLLPAIVLVLAAAAVVFFAVFRRKPFRKSDGGPGGMPIQEREALLNAAGKVYTQCSEARAAVQPLVTGDYSAGDQMGRILDELSALVRLQEQIGSAAREASKQAGDEG